MKTLFTYATALAIGLGIACAIDYSRGKVWWGSEANTLPDGWKVISVENDSKCPPRKDGLWTMQRTDTDPPGPLRCFKMVDNKTVDVTCPPVVNGCLQEQ